MQIDSMATARAAGYDLFFFDTPANRDRWAAGQDAHTVAFTQVLMPGFSRAPEGFTLLCLAVAPRTNTTTKGNKAFMAGR